MLPKKETYSSYVLSLSSLVPTSKLRIGWTLGFLVLAFALFSACGSTIPDNDEGELNGACYPNETCNGELVCIAGICQEGQPDGSGTDVSEDVTIGAGADVGVDTTSDPGADVETDAGTDAGTDVGSGAGADEGALPDTSGCEAGTGCFLDPCQENGDCLSGICLLHMGGSVCSELCVDECSQGWSCRTIDTGSTDSLFACVSNASHLCLPCIDNGDCSANDVQNVCVDYGDAGRFCGAPCEENTECPLGYICEEVLTAQGGFSNQCIRESGTCECSDYAVSMGLVTDCSVINEFGTCTGVRACTADGLADCNAPEPAPEICNGVDDDCDGAMDDDAPCDDENPCTADECTEFGCDNVPQAGAACDDENPNTKDDVCNADGECGGTIMDCPVDDCIESSTPNGAICETEYKAQGESCDDGDLATAGDQCDGAGTCAGTPLVCETSGCIATATPNGTDCDFDYWVEGYDCDDGDVNTNNDQCDGAGTCEGTSYSCEASQCEQSSTPDGSGCVVENKMAGIACDDGDLSTAADQCDGDGACAGTSFVCDSSDCIASSSPNGTNCDYVYQDAGFTCDDGDLTTNNDQCDGAGECSGSTILCESSTCIVSSSPNGTNCDYVYQADGFACDDGDLTTNNDQCDGAGTCAGTFYTCPDLTICTTAYTRDGEGCVPTHAPDTTVCRAATGECDVTELCNAGSCPADSFALSGTSCGDPSETVCSAPDVCTGGGDCIDNHVADGSECGGDYLCSGGECEPPAVPVVSFTANLNANHSSTAGDNHNFSVTAVDTANTNSTVTYQWYLSTDNGSSYSEIAGATSNTLTRYNPFYHSDDGHRIKCRATVTNSSGTHMAESTVCSLQVNPKFECGPGVYSGEVTISNGGLKPSGGDSDEQWGSWSPGHPDVCEIDGYTNHFNAGGRCGFCQNDGVYQGYQMHLELRITRSTDDTRKHWGDPTHSSNSCGKTSTFHINANGGGWNPDTDGSPTFRLMIIDNGTHCQNGAGENIFAESDEARLYYSYKVRQYEFHNRP